MLIEAPPIAELKEQVYILTIIEGGIQFNNMTMIGECLNFYLFDKLLHNIMFYNCRFFNNFKGK